MKMKLKYNFVTNEVVGKTVAVAIGDDLEKFNGFIKMNDVGAYIFNMLKNDVTEHDLVEAMKKEYPNETEDEINKTVSKFIEEMKKNGIIE